MKANTISAVIVRLEAIVQAAQEKGDPLGIFAKVYLAVTKSVQDGIRSGSFQDGPRMERLDVAFANRYLDAHDAFSLGLPCTQAWKSCFEEAKRFDLLVLQHLFMGMNAHINLDLGIAAAESAGVGELAALEADFNKINELLGQKIDALQEQLNLISPLLFLLDWFGKRRDERFAEFSLVKARSNAWQAAKRLSKLSDADKALEIKELDEYVALLNKLIAKPGMLFGGLVRFAKWWEVKDVKRVLEVL